MLEAGVHTEILEDQQEDENIVHAERFFDQVSGKKLQTGAASVRRENPRSESDREGNPKGAFERRFANRNRMCVPVEQAQVEQEEQCHSRVESDPEGPGTHLCVVLARCACCLRGEIASASVSRDSYSLGFESDFALSGSMAFRLVNWTRATWPARTVTGTSQRSRTSPAMACVPSVPSRGIARAPGQGTCLGRRGPCPSEPARLRDCARSKECFSMRSLLADQNCLPLFGRIDFA